MPPPAWSLPAYLRLARMVGSGVREAVGGLVASGAPAATARAAEPPDLRGAAARLLAPAPEVPTPREGDHAPVEPAAEPGATGVAHPAYPAILAQLSPDEARLLAHLLGSGAVPAVDVVSGGAVGRVLPSVLAQCLTELDLHVELWKPCRMPQYFNNLFRLGLVWHSPEPVEPASSYRALESRAMVRAVVRTHKRSRLVRRSLHLTPLGEDFTRACFADGAG
jgi:hypothetical protein